jgi:hypothetical protein
MDRRLVYAEATRLGMLEVVVFELSEEAGR